MIKQNQAETSQETEKVFDEFGVSKPQASTLINNKSHNAPELPFAVVITIAGTRHAMGVLQKYNVPELHKFWQIYVVQICFAANIFTPCAVCHSPGDSGLPQPLRPQGLTACEVQVVFAP